MFKSWSVFIGPISAVTIWNLSEWADNRPSVSPRANSYQFTVFVAILCVTMSFFFIWVGTSFNFIKDTPKTYQIKANWLNFMTMSKLGWLKFREKYYRFIQHLGAQLFFFFFSKHGTCYEQSFFFGFNIFSRNFLSKHTKSFPQNILKI